MYGLLHHPLIFSQQHSIICKQVLTKSCSINHIFSLVLKSPTLAFISCTQPFLWILNKHGNRHICFNIFAEKLSVPGTFPAPNFFIISFTSPCLLRILVSHIIFHSSAGSLLSIFTLFPHWLKMLLPYPFELFIHINYPRLDVPQHFSCDLSPISEFCKQNFMFITVSKAQYLDSTTEQSLLHNDPLSISNKRQSFSSTLNTWCVLNFSL